MLGLEARVRSLFQILALPLANQVTLGVIEFLCAYSMDIPIPSPYWELVAIGRLK